MPNVPLPFPRRGITEAFAFSDQPPETSYDEQNVRVRDPKTGRLRGAQRAGHTEWYDGQVIASANNKVQLITSVQMDKENVTFANKSTGLDSTDTDSTVDTPSGGDCKNAVMDRLGNIYALDGNSGIVKYNPNLKELYRFSFPTENQDDVIRALAVDDFFSVYAAVSEGTKPEDATIFCYIPDIDSNLLPLWSTKPGGFVKELQVKDNVLYGILDRTDTLKSELFSISDIDAPNPSTSFRREIPYPANDFDIGPDGSIYVSHAKTENNELRGYNPKAPDADPVFESWTPRDYDDFDEKIWCWHSADNIDGQGNSSLLEDQDILAWYDQSGNGRHYYAAIDESLSSSSGAAAVQVTPPTYRESAQAGRPGVNFNGVSNLMKSKPNDSTSYAYRDAQKTGVPAHRPALDASGAAIAETDCAYLMFLAVRVDPEEEGLVARYLWSHEDADVGASDGHRHFIVNRTSAAKNNALSASDRARITVWEETTGTGNGPAANLPASGNGNSDFGFDDSVGAPPTYGDALDNTSGMLFLTYLCDGNFQSGTFDASTTHSLVRINGRPIDRYISLPAYSLNPDYLGGTGIDDGDLDNPATGEVKRFFRGQILERIVFSRGDIDTSSPTTEPIISDHQEFGNTAAFTGCEAWPGVGSTNQDSDLITLTEGYLAQRWGKRTNLPDDSSVGNSTHYGHPYETKVPLAPSEPASANIQNQRFSTPFVTKWSGDSAQHLWTTGEVGGLSIVVDSDGQITVLGPTGSAPAVDVRSFPETDGLPGTTIWTSDLGMLTTTATYSDNYPRLALDSKNNVYVPVVATHGTGPDGDVVVFQQDGTQINDWDRDTDQWLVYAVLPSSVPDYPDSLSDQRSVFFYAFGKDTDENSDDQDNIAKVRIVTETALTGAARERQVLAVVGGSLWDVSAQSSKQVVDGGSLQFGGGARFVDSTVFDQCVFFTNGLVYKKYATVGGSSSDGIMTDWEATSGGEIPPRCRIISRWNGRVLLARGDDPFDFYMSKKNDPLNWDFIPPVATVDQAIRVSDSRLGAVPDIINALIPMSEDVLLIGCDHSIHRMAGEPLVGGSSYDLISDQVGVAWNSGWTKDRSGNVYVMDTQGGVLRVAANGQIDDLTRDAIDERLRAIDFSTYYPKLIWSERLRGLHVYVMPYGNAPSTIIDHYFWEEQANAWHVDRFFRSIEQPTAAHVIDGDDPDDRELLIGTAGDTSSVGGYILREDPDAVDDNDQLIDSYAVIGPIFGGDADAAVRFSGFEFALADDRDGALLFLYGSDGADVRGTARYSKWLQPGRNGRWTQKMRAAAAWIELRNARKGESWAFESARCMAHPAGRLRPRPRENQLGL